jgi:hypothetical protein
MQPSWISNQHFAKGHRHRSNNPTKIYSNISMVSENNDFYDAKTLSPIDDHPGFQINKNTDVFFRVIYKEHSNHVRNPTHMW